MLRLAGKAFFWGLVFVASWWLITVTTGLKHGAFFSVFTTILAGILWSKALYPRMDRWNDGQNAKYRRERLARERLEAEAHARIAAFDEAITSARSAYVPRSAFDAETQQAMGMPMYHTHYISPEHQRYLEEFYVDDEGLPSLKAGVHVYPIPVTGPELIDAPPKPRGFVIPVERG